MTGHFCIKEVEAGSPIPVISALPALRDAVASSTGAVGLLGTRVVMQSGAYGTLQPAEMVLPEGELFDAVHEAYVGMATAGRATSEQSEVLVRAGRDLSERGARRVVLGGTDMFLVFKDRDCGFTTLDCADIHTDEIHRIATV